MSSINPTILPIKKNIPAKKYFENFGGEKIRFPDISILKVCVALNDHQYTNGDQSMSFARGSGIFSIACCNRSSRASL